MTKLVQKMLQDEVIQESESPWASLVVLVRKTEHSASALITDISMP